MTFLLAKLWRIIRGPLQWYVLWFFHNKFIIGVSGVILNGEGQVLLLRHRYWPRDSWGLPSGYARKSEKLEDALLREVLEETGYIIKTESLLKITSGYKLRLEVHYLAYLTGGKLKLNNDEVLEANFFSLNKLPDGLLMSHRQLINFAFPAQAA